MRKSQILYYQWIDPLLDKAMYVKYFILSRIRWIGLHLFPPKTCADHRLNMDYYMLMTTSGDDQKSYINALQKIRNKTCNKRTCSH